MNDIDFLETYEDLSLFDIDESVSVKSENDIDSYVCQEHKEPLTNQNISLNNSKKYEVSKFSKFLSLVVTNNNYHFILHNNGIDIVESDDIEKGYGKIIMLAQSSGTNINGNVGKHIYDLKSYLMSVGYRLAGPVEFINERNMLESYKYFTSSRQYKVLVKNK